MKCSSIFSQSCDWHALFPYMTSFEMTTWVLSFSESTKNRNSLKTMSYTETKFGVS